MLNPSPVINHTFPISILLVDDNPEFRRGLCTLLDFYCSTSNVQLKVVGQAASATQALSLAKEQKPTLILLDLEMEQSDGIQFLHDYSQIMPNGKVLVLSGHAEDEWVYKAMQAGARGYLVKQHLSTQLYQAIDTVMREQIYLAADIAAGFFRLFHFYSGQSLKTTSTIHLTEREKDVLQCLAEGNSNADIAQRLFLEVGTVKFYLRDIFAKLGVENRTQAALKALKLGIVSV
ncbi:MAG: response regulator transcription factor [Cyanobacteria bacterium P01_F01_bin.56]